MIASLRGKVIFRDTTRVILDVQGVGYDVSLSLPAVGSLPEDGEVFLHVHTALRENALELYGFVDQEEKILFEMLIGVTGIGPRLALTILSGISPGLFQRAVLEGDTHRLTAISGIGKKSAERIVLELKEKIRKVGFREFADAASGSSTALEADLISSLVNLGYKAPQAKAVAGSVIALSGPGLSLTEAVRLALKELAT
jgi:Holliday junction DNA helicase RuvA